MIRSWVILRVIGFHDLVIYDGLGQLWYEYRWKSYELLSSDHQLAISPCIHSRELAYLVCNGKNYLLRVLVYFKSGIPCPLHACELLIHFHNGL